MADEADFFTPPPMTGDDNNNDGGAFFAAPPPPEYNGDVPHVGDVYYGSMPEDGGGGGDAFFASSPPEVVSGGIGYDSYNGDIGNEGGGMVEDVNDDDDDDDAVLLNGSSSGGKNNNNPMDKLALSSTMSTPMSKWNDEYQAILNQRKEEENSAKAGYVAKAAEDVKAFLLEREKRREARMAKNRSDEQDKLEAIEADLENDNSWQKVVKMIDLTTAAGTVESSTGKKDKDDKATPIIPEDVSRMKDILVLMKNDPAKASAMS
jgi:hypothetical protein